MICIPTLRRLLAIPVALVAVMAFASSASAAAPTQIDVGTHTTTGTHPINGVSKNRFSISIGGVNWACTGATPTGTVASGPHTAGTAFMSIANANLVGCTGIFGIGLTFTNNCDGLVKTYASSNVTSAMTDSVAVKLDLGAGCLHMQTAAPFSSCTLDIAGQVNATFKETPQPDGSQELSLSGNTLYATNVGDCYGNINANDTVSFTLDLSITSTDGPINLK